MFFWVWRINCVFIEIIILFFMIYILLFYIIIELYIVINMVGNIKFGNKDYWVLGSIEEKYREFWGVSY